MKNLSEIGVKLKLGNEWEDYDNAPKNLQPYFYKGYKCNDIVLYILTYGNLIGEDNGEYVKYKLAELQSEFNNKILFSQISLQGADKNDVSNLKVLFEKGENGQYNYDLYTIFLGKLKILGCITISFSDYENLKEVEDIINNKIILGE